MSVVTFSFSHVHSSPHISNDSFITTFTSKMTVCKFPHSLYGSCTCDAITCVRVRLKTHMNRGLTLFGTPDRRRLTVLRYGHHRSILLRSLLPSRYGRATLRPYHGVTVPYWELFFDAYCTCPTSAHVSPYGTYMYILYMCI